MQFSDITDVVLNFKQKKIVKLKNKQKRNNN